MVKKVISESSAEQIEMKEVVSHIDAASGLLAHAAQSFTDVCAIFEAIKAAVECGSLISRLATLGIDLTESLDSDFTGYRDDYNAYTEGYWPTLYGDSVRRSNRTKDSLPAGFEPEA